MKTRLRHGSTTAGLRALATLVTAIALWFFATSLFEEKLLEEQRVKHLSELTPYGSNLSTLINTRLALANSLEAFVRSERNVRDLKTKFTSFAEGLYAGNSGVRAIQVFPPEGTEYVYPLRTNEKVAGGGLKALLADDRPDVRSDLKHAIETRRLSLSGPYELRQGGLGLVARKAIFNEEGFWGFAVVVLDVPPMLESAGIYPSTTPELLMAVKDDKGKVFAGDPVVFSLDPVSMTIKLPEHEWVLAAVPIGGWNKSYSLTLRWFRSGGLLVAVLISILIYLTSNHGTQLRSAVSMATSALQESESKLKEAQELGKIGSWEFNLETKTIAWSDQVYKLYNRRPELGPPSEEEEASYYTSETASQLREYTLTVSKRGGSVAYDFEADIPGKGIRYFSAIMRGDKNSDGTVSKLFGTVQDITERKQAAMEIEALNASLEKRVATRTAELEAANKDLEAFSYSVSHDLRAPLRAINGFSRILTEEHGAALDQESQRLCRIISKNAENMGSLIDNLLDFSRLGRASLTLEPIAMAALVNSLFLELTTEETRKRIDFIASNLPDADADPALIRQVWINLLSNAIKFSKHREKSVIRIEGEIKEGMLTYRIKDNGAGFDMRYADKLFGVFQRLHGQIEFEGTGVGLAIVKRIINRHGGDIWADSCPDEGAVFTFTLKKGA